ncbi:hypothetical protein [Caulobacter sp. NIBR1757]|uniref:hypothetical protein n=1 Tax=Caulobacter sp. NIBR1757 TaxID=3016000 RepID=UPI0022F03E90|nr:hypothetical protein [Caulobacter sp. NIBR1757]WGM38324.1 hypothetical protein AMEJIAPC_01227 [Caulobacter sp. NIBR1757]
MSAVEIRFPVNRLRQQLRTPGGKSMAEALKDAQAGLDTLAAKCLLIIDQALMEIAQAQLALPDPPTAESLRRLYEASNSLIGLGGATGLLDLDQAAYSFCDLLDLMIDRQRADTASIRVHIESMTLLRRPELLGSGADAQVILLGLKQVRDRFAMTVAPSD